MKGLNVRPIQRCVYFLTQKHPVDGPTIHIARPASTTSAPKHLQRHHTKQAKCFQQQQQQQLQPQTCSRAYQVASQPSTCKGCETCDNKQIHDKPQMSTVQQLTVNLNMTEQHVEIQLGSKSLGIPFMWLRDNCKCDKCFNHSTQQKIPDVQLMERDLTPAAVESQTGDILSITWQDGHKTEHKMDWLTQQFYPGRLTSATRRTLWNKQKIGPQQFPIVPFEQHMESEEGLRKSLENLVRYGFTMVVDAPPTVEGTRLASERVSPMQESMYGGLWTVSPSMGNNDTAYTHESLGAHTDNTYLTSPAGIEVFHILKQGGTGGDTLIVDGFHALDTLRQEDHESWKLLKDTPIPFEYVATAADGKPPYHMKTYSPIFTTHPGSGEYITFRFNAYDRGTVDTVHPDKLEEFYTAYHKLHQVIERPESELNFKLQPGMVLLLDNWRVMHGRSAFTGYRLLSGCYLSRDEWVSQARLMGVL